MSKIEALIVAANDDSIGLLGLCDAVEDALPELRALLAERDALREQQHKLEVHEKDCPVFRDFFHKHAIGEMINPSCLVCGKETKRSEAAITHLELADIVVCVRCRDAAQSILNSTLSEGERT